MISIKQYLDGNALDRAEGRPSTIDDTSALPALLAAYGGLITATGCSTFEACPNLGNELKKRFFEASSLLSIDMTRESLKEIELTTSQQLLDWGRQAGSYYRARAGEVKELLLTVTQTAESLGARDRRYTSQMALVTARLHQIATLEDVAQIRFAVEKGVSELKSTIERMASEGESTIEELRQQMKVYQEKLINAEERASRDPLTGLSNRSLVESVIDARIAAGSVFCVGILDLDGFKEVNDTHGHEIGDELLKMFANELRSACRSTDTIGRWGGDEFILLVDSGLNDGLSRMSRLRQWVCGEYKIRNDGRELNLYVHASVGLAEHRKGESKTALISRADAAMYECKASANNVRSLKIIRPRSREDK